MFEARHSPFLSVFDAGVSETFGRAVRNASTPCHACSRHPRSTGQGSASTAFPDTTHVRVVGGYSGSGGSVADGGVVCCRDVGGSINGDRVVSGESFDRVAITDVLIDLGVGRLTRLSGSTVEERNEGRTVLEDASYIALIDSLLQDAVTIGSSGPTVDEVSVHTVTGSVALGIDPRRSDGVEGELLNLVDDFVKQHGQVDGMRRRTSASVNASRRPGHVGHVIGGVQILTIPAGSEVDLSTHATRAVVLEEVVSLKPFRVVGCLRTTTKTDV